MITICTTSLTFNKSTFWPHSVFVFFANLRTNSYYFPIKHWLVFITETERIYCAVRYWSLNVLQVYLSLSGLKVCVLVSSVCCNAASRIEIILYRCTFFQSSKDYNNPRLIASSSVVRQNSSFGHPPRLRCPSSALHITRISATLI